MKLGTVERIVLLNLLPKEGDFRTLKIVRDLQSNLGFSEEESAALQFKEGASPGLIQWNVAAESTKDVPMGPVAHEVIAATLRRLDTNKQLHSSQIGLYERFVLANSSVAEA